jgi:lysyl-tRNA synthetase class 2
MSLSAMRRDPQTPNGLIEFLVAKAVESLRTQGVEELSLNFASFARLLRAPRSRLERIARRAVLAADGHFQIESLYRFNAKFFPRWEPRYLLYQGPWGLPRAGIAALRAEGQLPRFGLGATVARREGGWPATAAEATG